MGEKIEYGQNNVLILLLLLKHKFNNERLILFLFIKNTLSNELALIKLLEA